MIAERLIIVVGLSGSGKSTALNAIEDKGFFCIENIPAPLVTSIVDSLVQASRVKKGELPSVTIEQDKASKFALLVDCRDAQLFSYVEDAVAKLRKVGTQVEILFIDCEDETVLRRFRETRRPHPLLVGGDGSLTLREALAKERQILSRFREVADRVIDTTGYTPGQLRKVIEDYLGEKSDQLEITVQSFGFKYGVPQDSDLVIDVRFLPNPFYIPELKDLTGFDDAVYKYVVDCDDAREFLKYYLRLLDYLIPGYQKEGKRYLTISVGCTGGKHRSVSLARYIANELSSRSFRVYCQHRDVKREID